MAVRASMHRVAKAEFEGHENGVKWIRIIDMYDNEFCVFISDAGEVEKIMLALAEAAKTFEPEFN